MVKQLLVMIAALAVAGASIYYRREEARNATDYTDPLGTSGCRGSEYRSITGRSRWWRGRLSRGRKVLN